MTHAVLRTAAIDPRVDKALGATGSARRESLASCTTVAGRGEPVLVTADSHGFGPPVRQDWKVIAWFRRPEPVAARFEFLTINKR